jgi:DNA (cytosine-5)-methyltransferase 1
LAADWVWGDEHEIVSFCEIDPFCQKVLKKHWPDVPIISDIREVSGIQYEINLLTAGTPCQPASCAGKQRGTEDDRWLWPECFRVIREIRPTWCILENVKGLTSLEQGVVFEALLTELESYGYETETFIIPACAVDAPHRRDRVWIVANSQKRTVRPGLCKNEQAEVGGRRFGDGGGERCQDVADTKQQGLEGFSGDEPRGNQPGRNETKKNRPTCQTGLRQDVADTEDSRDVRWNRELGTIKAQHDHRRGQKDGGGERRHSQSRLGDKNDGISRWLARCGYRWDDGSWDTIPRVATDVPDRVNKLKALGNAICVPTVIPIMQAIKDLS